MMEAAASASDPFDASINNQNQDGIATTSSTRVLIVEDEALVALNMEAAMNDAGFEVVGVADNPADAIKLAKEFKPQVVLMDITLRGGDGITCAKAILEVSKSRIIFVSGNSDPRTLSEAMKTNPASFIRKPFLTKDLTEQVRAAISVQN